ncbi:hypothetical protein JL49_23995 [Pseudoalteromonas luteoviolacea]|uniref:Uncharacterized protein n=1 Tax=Pseudoalteromonas luteoviolacea NCIMB 1942 TaxID=1365253 RepID=A0A167G9Z7_9GAMM|nr:hypothetical protein N482_24460 [Pseudoalteromonas luteoviolacea NCIMB 1942]KZW98332.1 hypothetical protein JL49_23995 [Pseudoalteromonas luteoviolacea]
MNQSKLQAKKFKFIKFRRLRIKIYLNLDIAIIKMAKVKELLQNAKLFANFLLIDSMRLNSLSTTRRSDRVTLLPNLQIGNLAKCKCC